MVPLEVVGGDQLGGAGGENNGGGKKGPERARSSSEDDAELLAQGIAAKLKFKGSSRMRNND